MRRIASLLGILILLTAWSGSAAADDSLSGVVTLGGISKDETLGDMSSMRETANIHDGFVVSQVKLDARLGEKNLFRVDLHEINQDSRSGLFSYRVPGGGGVTVRYDMHRQLFDAAGTVVSEREDWRIAGYLTPKEWLRLNVDYGLQYRDGGRIGYPSTTGNQLGVGYDYALKTGRVEAEARHEGWAMAAGMNFSEFDDHDLAAAARQGRVFFARLHVPLLDDMLSNHVRVSSGKEELENLGHENTLSTFEYLGIIRPHRAWDVRYRFGWNRTEYSVEDLQTDLIRNDMDVTWHFPHGSVTGGGGYVTNDDDHRLTEYEVWRFGARYARKGFMKARFSYATSTKTDQERRTLLQDVEANRFKMSVQSYTGGPIDMGLAYAEREREFPTLNVEATGKRASAFGRVTWPGWGAINLDYSYSDDRYLDLAGSFRADNHMAGARVDFERITNLRLSAGVTYLDIGQDLDIEKSIVSFEGRYDLLDDYFVEARYNAYNYDDYVLLDRYYTANVVWLNVGYRFMVN